MIKSIVKCLGGRLRLREKSVWGEYCVGAWKGEKKGGKGRSEADCGSCSYFAGRFSIKRMYFTWLVSGVMKGMGSDERGTRSDKGERCGEVGRGSTRMKLDGWGSTKGDNCGY